MNIKPRTHFAHILPFDTEIAVRGIIMPREEGDPQNLNLAKVLSVGPHSAPSKTNDADLKAGDFVLYPDGCALFPIHTSPLANQSNEQSLPKTLLIEVPNIVAVVEGIDESKLEKKPKVVDKLAAKMQERENVIVTA